MKTSIDCIPCFVRQTLDACRMVSDDPALHEKMMREVLGWISEMDLSASPPVLAQRIHRRLRELTGVTDPYRDAKAQQNQMAMQMLPDLQAEVVASDDPFSRAVHLAIAGNIIDLGAKSGLTDSDIHASLEQAASEELLGDLEAFRSAVSAAKNILYLADNAGEIVFDRLLIEQLPRERVTFAVRGVPILNDVTRVDAATVGIDTLVEVMDNGSDAPGTVLADCSEDFQKRFAEADLIISKGQGNFETLSDSPGNIFFLFKAKCPVVADQVGCPVGMQVLYCGRKK